MESIQVCGDPMAQQAILIQKTINKGGTVKRVLIMGLVFILFGGCKSEVTRQLDEVEKRISLASTPKELEEIAGDLNSIYDAKNGRLNQNEKDRYYQLSSWMLEKNDTLLLSLRREYAQTIQKGMQENGWMNLTTKLLGDKENILVISGPLMDVYKGKMFSSDEETALGCRMLGFKKVIFSNSLGPVYTWEP